jgi:hypothetical protein
MPAKRTSGFRTRSNLSKLSPSSKARLISMARSPRKLKRTTASPSTMGATGVEDAGLLAAEGLDRGQRRRELPALGEDVGPPAALDDAPVGLVAIHRHVHAAAARRDAGVDAGGAQLAQRLLDAIDVERRRGRRHVATVEERVHVELPGAALGRLAQHRLEVVDVGVDVAVGEEAQEVDGRAALGAVDDGLPGGAGEQLAAGDGAVDQQRALGDDPAGAERVVADLAVAHVVVGGQADGGAVGAQLGARAGDPEPIEGRRLGEGDGVGLVALAAADTVEDREDHRALGTGEASVAAKRPVHRRSP